MRKPKVTTQFEKDVKRMERRGYEMQKLSVIIPQNRPPFRRPVLVNLV